MWICIQCKTLNSQLRWFFACFGVQIIRNKVLLAGHKKVLHQRLKILKTSSSWQSRSWSDSLLVIIDQPVLCSDITISYWWTRFIESVVYLGQFINDVMLTSLFSDPLSNKIIPRLTFPTPPPSVWRHLLTCPFQLLTN